jgi:mRNA interferase RelE/StbE
MAWRTEFERAARELDKLGPQSAAHILRFLRDRIAPLDDARSIGQALKGERFGEFWRCRIGDTRAIARIDDAAALILVLRIGHPRKSIDDGQNRLLTACLLSLK